MLAWLKQHFFCRVRGARRCPRTGPAGDGEPTRDELKAEVNKLVLIFGSQIGVKYFEMDLTPTEALLHNILKEQQVQSFDIAQLLEQQQRMEDYWMNDS